MSRVLYVLGRFAARRPLVTIGAWLGLAAAVIAAGASFGRAFDDRLDVPGSDSTRAVALLDAAGAERAGLTAQVVLTPRADGVTFTASTRALEAAREVRDRLAALPHVVGVSEPAGAVSDDGRVALLRVQYPVMRELETRDLDHLEDALAELREGTPGQALRIEANGELFFAFDEPESGVGEVAGVAMAAIILLVAFGSLIAMGLPIVLALLGLAAGLGSLPLVGYLIEIPSWSTMLAAMVGLGVGIDYALLLVSRHREQLAHGLPVEESVGRAVATAGRTIVFAGGTVLVAILGLAVAGLPFVTAGGVAISVVVLAMVTGSVTLLPALLGLAGPWIDRLRVGRSRPQSAGYGWWERWARHVTRHPRRYALGATALLIVLSAPVTALRLGTPDDGTLPQSRSERRAYDLVASGFGPGANGPFLIAVEGAHGPAAAAGLRNALARDPGIASVEAPVADAGSGIASVTAIPATAPQDQATRETLLRLRDEVIPQALEGTGAQAYVGGQTAQFVDMSDRIADRLPAFVATVVGLSLVLLILVFRSVAVPIKAAVLNLLSIGAAYGVMVMVFQWGWGASLIGVHHTVPIVSFIPMFMFAIAFGLSMDYEVFLLSRIREHYLATGDDGAAIVRGLASTGRVITSAALIMVAVFLGFVAGSDPSTKMFGLGLATAILVDATIVRMVLVPAAMTLMGRANWWLPAWLERRLPGRVGHGPMAGQPATAEARTPAG
ncbi:MAG: MMPL family transporter [Actinobacteria bacterium]|nr:MMPL family transporter [Actinomycetota bacterium]